MLSHEQHTLLTTAHSPKEQHSSENNKFIQEPLLEKHQHITYQENIFNNIIMASDEISTPKPVSIPEKDTVVDSEPEMSTLKPVSIPEKDTVMDSEPEMSAPKPVNQPEENTAVNSEPEMSTPKPVNQQEENTIENSKSEILGFNMGVDMVDIFVGQTQTHFRVHKDLLCSRVPYFKAMFKGAFMESQTQSAKFPEEAATTVALFIEWLYASCLRPTDYTKSTATSGPLWDRILLYGFAEKLCLPDLCDYLMSNLITAYRTAGLLPSIQGVILAYQNTNERSPLRKFMVQALHIVLMQKDEDYEPSDIMGNAMAECPDLVVDHLRLLRPGKPVAKNPTLEMKCKFHIHQVGKECPHKVDIL